VIPFWALARPAFGVDAVPPAPPAGPQPPALATAWPRPAQLAAAFLLGAAAALLGVRIWGGGSPRPLDLHPAALPAHAVDLNRAGATELRQLPGVGPTLATRITERRDGLRTANDLRTVPGVGPARLERVRPWVRTDADHPADMSAPVANAPHAARKGDGIKEPIDVNRVAAEDLQKLPGVGATMAQRILDARAKAPFKTVDDLRRVPGIGPKTLEKLRPFVTVGSEETEKTRPRMTTDSSRG
jgi:competence protein ComEA